jgi:ATP-binding cassette subfamily B protein/subfamily B ATP-binding cassette protein MsbA
MFALGLGVTLVSGLVPVLVQLLVEIYDRTPNPSIQRLVPGEVQALFPRFFHDREFLAGSIPYCFPLLFLALGLFRFFSYTLQVYNVERIVASIRMDLVRKILRLNLTFHGSLERGSGGLISRVFNDPVLLQQGLAFYGDLIREPIQAMIYLAYMVWLDWKLTLFALVFLPFFAIASRKVSKSLRKYGRIGRESMDDLTAVLKDAVDGVRVVQSFNLESEMEKRFQSTLREYLRTQLQIIMREVAVSPINEFLVSFLVMGFAIYSIDKVLGGDGGSSRFIGFMAAAGFLQAPLKKLQDSGVKIQQLVVVTERIFEILESPAEVPQARDPLPFPKDWQSIEFRDVCFSYGGEPTLKDVSLTVKRGEVVALVGESGSGKSTLVNLLERFYDPTSGEILIDGIPITRISLQDLRHNVALVTQDVFLFRDSIERNIHAGDFGKGPGDIQSAAQLANAQGFIAKTPRGFQSPVGERGSFLSGGEKQRVSIARAIFKDAPILILDEATSALDSVSEMEVQKGLNRLMENRTTFVIAHRFSTIFNADRILVMKKGEIIEQGTHATLLAKGGEYHNFFQLQMRHEDRAAGEA